MDSAIAAQLKATLLTLLAAGAPTAPAYWLTVLGEVAFASSPGQGGQLGAIMKAGEASGDAGDRRGDDADDDDRPAPGPSTPKAGTPSHRQGGTEAERSTGSGQNGTAAAAFAPAAGSGKDSGALDAATRKALSALATPRLRTRLFAAECLLRMLQAVDSDGNSHQHDGEAVAPTRGSGGLSCGLSGAASTIAPPPPGSDLERLSAHLAVLVDMGFKLATGQVRAKQGREG